MSYLFSFGGGGGGLLGIGVPMAKESDTSDNSGFFFLFLSSCPFSFLAPTHLWGLEAKARRPDHGLQWVKYPQGAVVTCLAPAGCAWMWMPRTARQTPPARVWKTTRSAQTTSCGKEKALRRFRFVSKSPRQGIPFLSSILDETLPPSPPSPPPAPAPKPDST